MISISSHNIPSNALHTCLKGSFSAFSRHQNYEKQLSSFFWRVDQRAELENLQTPMIQYAKPQGLAKKCIPEEFTKKFTIKPGILSKCVFFGIVFRLRAVISNPNKPSESRNLAEQALKTCLNIPKLLGITELKLFKVQDFESIFAILRAVFGRKW